MHLLYTSSLNTNGLILKVCPGSFHQTTRPKNEDYRLHAFSDDF